MATVFRARDRVLGVQRAIKMLRPEHSGAEDLRERLRIEAQAMARLEHPNILPILDVGTEGDYFYVVMPLADRGSLQDLLKAKGPLPWEAATRCIIQVLAALSNAHTLDVVHRDVKPQNILLGSRGQAMLADFGIAMLAHNQNRERNTITGVSMGSPSFMPPEQRVDARTVDHRADIYSAGATFYAMLTCRTPVDLYTAEADSPRWRDLPTSFIRVIRQATAMHPDERFQSALQMANAILTASEEAGTQPAGLAGLMQGPAGENLFVTSASLPDSPTTLPPEGGPVQHDAARASSLPPSNMGAAADHRWPLRTAGLLSAVFLLALVVTTGLLSARAAGLLTSVVEQQSEVPLTAAPSSAEDTDVLIGVSEHAAGPDRAGAGGPVGTRSAVAPEEAGLRAAVVPPPSVQRKKANAVVRTRSPERPVVTAPVSDKPPVAPQPQAPSPDSSTPVEERVVPEPVVGVNGKGVVGALFRSWKTVGAGRIARLVVVGEPETVVASYTSVKGSQREQRRLTGSWESSSSMVTLTDRGAPEDGVWKLTLSADGTRLSGIHQAPGGMPSLLSLVPDE